MLIKTYMKDGNITECQASTKVAAFTALWSLASSKIAMSTVKLSSAPTHQYCELVRKQLRVDDLNFGPAD